MHLYWNMDENAGPLVEASAVLEILEAPAVAKTYFWALQASFTDDNGGDHGAAHLGLQWDPPHPNSGAVNWGGYPPQNDNWKVTLTGSDSPLPSTTNDPNTRDYPWQVGVRYRLRIFRSPRRVGVPPSPICRRALSIWSATCGLVETSSKVLSFGPSGSVGAGIQP
jgi:hypothetical protein